MEVGQGRASGHKLRRRSRAEGTNRHRAGAGGTGEQGQGKRCNLRQYKADGRAIGNEGASVEGGQGQRTQN